MSEKNTRKLATNAPTVDEHHAFKEKDTSLLHLRTGATNNTIKAIVKSKRHKRRSFKSGR
jgi:hypothetical protein